MGAEERYAILVVEEVEVPEEMRVPGEGFVPYTIEVRIRGEGELEFHYPQIALGVNRRYERFIYPEWRSGSNKKGWAKRDQGRGERKDFTIYYYYPAERFEPNFTYTHPITILIGSRAREGRYRLYVSAGAYIQERCKEEDWLWTGWGEFFIRLTK